MIELFVLGGLAGYSIWNGICKIEDRRLPRSTYAMCIGWWYGAFTGDSPAASIARLIDSDRDCTAWSGAFDNWGDETQRLVNETMKVCLSFNRGGWSGKKGLCTLTIQEVPPKKNKQSTNRVPSPREIEIPISPQDDYYLWGAYTRWVKRSRYIKLLAKNNQIDNLLNQRINENYQIMIERLEQNINKTQLMLEDQSDLKASLTPPPMPKSSATKKNDNLLHITMGSGN